MEKVKSFLLRNIADWQINPNDESIELPELQRGFVWKVNQIEGLWDSLLRGFPIGSFLLSTNADGKYFILDGQQRATSIAIGYYNPWHSNKSDFWSLKNIPVLWIDLAPGKEKTITQKYVLRLVSQSHPWGYRAVDNTNILTIPERRDALEIFRKIDDNKDKGYTLFSSKNVFPFDSHLPVPLSFLISSIKSEEDWKKHLVGLCKDNLPCKHIRTKFLKGDYLGRLSRYINDNKFGINLFQTVKNLDSIQIPAIIAGKEVLESEDEQTGDDPTLFERLNSKGTPISGEDLLYSIYKATFPKSKELVESVGIGFIAPSRIISLTARLALSEMNGNYPYPIGINDFRRHLKKNAFRQKLDKLIGSKENSQIALLFKTVLDIFLSKGVLDIPPVLARNLIASSPELLLMILQWLKNKKSMELTDKEKIRILAAFTGLSWFGRDNPRYVREIWGSLSQDNIWNRKTLSRPYYHNNEYIMYPLVQPDDLHEFLIEKVVEKKTSWGNLNTKTGDEINEQYKKSLEEEFEDESERQPLIDDIWGNFIEKLIHNKSLLLFAQRDYINQKFFDFNQLEILEDTNAPWDWDHIYPRSNVYYKQNVNENVKHWTNTIGNIRAISLEDNRADGSTPPSEKLIDNEDPEDSLRSLKISFITTNDWEKYWSKIDGRIYDNESHKIKLYLAAVINRLCSIYEEWYEKLEIGTLFYFN